MAEIAAGFLGPAIEVMKLCAKPITRQFNYLCCFTTNIHNLKDEAAKLDDETQGLEREVETATNNVQDIVPAVRTWSTNSNQIKEEITGILSEATNVESGCLKLGARFSVSKRAKKTTYRSKKHRGQKSFDSISQPRPPPATLTVPGGKTYEFKSRKKIEEDIMSTLRDGDVNLIGIYGMGGLGKTTMAQKIGNRVLIENVFQEVAMTVVSQQVDKSKIQVEIGGELGLDLKEETSRGKVQKLHARLSDTKRILVILDDVWQGLELEELGIPCDSKGCTILITSRNSDAMSAMGFKNKLFGMEILSEEEAWYLFREGAGTCVDDPNLNSIAKQVAQECKGLPIALKTLGLALKDKNIASIWNNALRELKQCDADIPNYSKEVYTPLKLSYDFLDLEKAKSLFLLCSLFPEDSNISLEKLTYFCMGLGIFGGIINLEEARNKTSSLTDNLKSRSLLLDSDYEDHVRMHDVVRDVCIVIAKREGCVGGNNCAWIASLQRLGERNELLRESRFQNLRLLSLRLSRGEVFRFDNAFLEGIKDLYVLCIEAYWGWGLTSLPHSTQSLINLKTMFLDSCWELKSISVVGKLRNLEILICRKCALIEELPSEMKGLNRLKLLELTECRKLQSIGRGIISSLVGLEELKMHSSFKRWEAEDREERENAGLKEVQVLTNLRCLEIEIDDPALAAENMHLSPKLKTYNIMIGKNVSSKEVGLHHKRMYLRLLEGEGRLGDWIEMQLLRDTKGLYLFGNGANNVDLAKCQNIRSLVLEKCKTMKSIITTSILVDDATATPFPLLENIRLESLPELEEIWNGPISSNSLWKLKKLQLMEVGLNQFWKSSSQNNSVPLFSNLSSVEISYCDHLCNLGQLSIAGMHCLPQLEHLCIRRCKMMEQVFLWNDEEAGQDKNSIESPQNRHVITKVFPKLKEVRLYDLPNLETFYQGIEGIEFPLLEEMTIEECPKIKSIIIGRNDNNSSASADIDDHSLHLFCQSQKISFGGSLERLEMNHNPFCGHETPSSLFNGLKVLRITKYEGSMSLFTPAVAANLVSLEELYISSCDEMIKVIEDEQQQERILVFPKLEILKLTNLPKLVTFYDWKCEVEFPSLKEVDICNCPNMKNLSLGLVATPHLGAFTTDLTTYVGVGIGDGVAFDRLKELKIRYNENLWNDDKICVSLFNGLEKLTFSRCKGTTSLFSYSAVGNLVNLRLLEIFYCDEIVKVIVEGEKDDKKVEVSGGKIRTSVIFPKLEELRMWRLPKLVRFCEWKCEVELPSLTTLLIRDCPNMESFSMGFAVAPKLKIVEIDYEENDATKDLNGAFQQHYLARQTI